MEPTNYQNPTEFNIPPKNWLVKSILVTLFCCLPLGIAGIINASKVEGLFLAGDIAGANKAAADAKKWTMYGLFTGLTVIVLYVLLYVLFILLAINGTAS